MTIDKEIIVAAAIKLRLPSGSILLTETFDNQKVYPDFLIVSSPPPARHHTLLHSMHKHIESAIRNDDQGFLTSLGRFVDRKEALAIVIAAGQERINHNSRNDYELYSEDLW